MGRRTVKTRTLVMFPALCLLLLLVGCGGSSEGSSSDTKTLVLDIQPDFDKFDFTDSQTDEKLDFGDHFLFEGPVYEEGTTENVGTWFCAGVKFATLKETALDKPLTLTGAIDGNYANVYVTYVLRGRGTITVTGLEPGYDGSGGNVQVITGGTGEFADARGTATNVAALGANLSPPFAAPANGDQPKITMMSRRVELDYVTDE
jgi:hypothetical protein